MAIPFLASPPPVSPYPPPPALAQPAEVTDAVLGEALVYQQNVALFKATNGDAGCSYQDVAEAGKYVHQCASHLGEGAVLQAINNLNTTLTNAVTALTNAVAQLAQGNIVVDYNMRMRTYNARCVYSNTPLKKLRRMLPPVLAPGQQQQQQQPQVGAEPRQAVGFPQTVQQANTLSAADLSRLENFYGEQFGDTLAEKSIGFKLFIGVPI
mmetsp:Transcript_37966/g.84569  ORF Transcript_37966/g.84569 Transcript_37966/m.84569 type:complete len:210 (+) Transcript_37966:86-715(+)